jgi:hypothetical protein
MFLTNRRLTLKVKRCCSVPTGTKSNASSTTTTTTTKCPHRHLKCPHRLTTNSRSGRRRCFKRERQPLATPTSRSPTGLRHSTSISSKTVSNTMQIIDDRRRPSRSSDQSAQSTFTFRVTLRVIPNNSNLISDTFSNCCPPRFVNIRNSK